MPIGRLIYHAPDGEDYAYEIAAGQLALGRSAECDIVVNHPCVSRLHATITCNYERYSIVDSGSTNGTLVNGRPIYQETLLSHHDEIMLGSPEIYFTLHDPNGTQVNRAIGPAEILVDEATRIITVHGSALKLSPLEYTLLHFLAERAGEVCTREECFQAAWGAPYEQATCEAALNACVTKLRRHLRAAGEAAGSEPAQISVVPRVGFRLDAPARLARRDDPILLETAASA